MFLLNLTPAEFLWLLAVAWGVAVAIYLLDRTRRSVVVSALRLWSVSNDPARRKRRRWIQNPWSLLLQLAAMLLILAAAADFHIGWAGGKPRDHVILVDASAWMAARGGSGRTLLDEAKAAAIAYVRALPAADRAMVVQAAALAVPATGFESDRKRLEAAILQTRAGFTSLRLSSAVQFAKEALRSGGRPSGEVVYAGAGRIPREDTAGIPSPGLRVLDVSEPADNCGLREIGLRRVDGDAQAWEIFVAVRNYGRTRKTVPLAVQFAGQLIGSHDFALAAGEEQNVSFQHRSRIAGWVDVRLLTEDGLAGDDHARVEIPAQPVLPVLVYSTRAALLRPILEASPNLRAVFAEPRTYDPSASARIVILDGFAPPIAPIADTIWIRPPAGASPFRTGPVLVNAKLVRWHGAHALGAGLRTRDATLGPTHVFLPEPGDLAIADCAEGPVIIARAGAHKAVAFGFDPMREPVRSELSVPLVFANVLRWMAPDVFRRWDLNGGRVGPVAGALEPGTDPAAIRVLDEGGLPLPFAAGEGTIRFFTAQPGIVRVSSANHEVTYSQTLPDVADGKWQPPPGASRGPAVRRATWTSREWWPLLALAGLMVWIGEWLLFGRARYLAVRPKA